MSSSHCGISHSSRLKIEHISYLTASQISNKNKIRKGHPNSDLDSGEKEHRTKCVKSKGLFSQKMIVRCHKFVQNKRNAANSIFYQYKVWV